MNQQPYKSESPGGTGHNANVKTDTATLPPAQKIGNVQKQLATLHARCALAGVTLHQIENDHGKTVYIVSKWALTRELADLDAVSAWLEKVTGVRA